MDELKQYYDMINQQQQANNAWSAEQAQKAMDYQTQMSNTAHQREVADLKAAGLNPVLTAGGTGATTGSGVSANSGNENVTAMYGLISKMLDAQMVQAEALKTSAKGISGNSGNSSSVPIGDISSEDYDNAVSTVRGVIDDFLDSAFTDEEMKDFEYQEGRKKFFSWLEGTPVFSVLAGILSKGSGISRKDATKIVSDVLTFVMDKDIERTYNTNKMFDRFASKIKQAITKQHKISYSGRTTNAQGKGSAARINYSMNRSRSISSY